jgi:ABC-type nitrate/sulfonate/bicarbonate transport system substrate-binding protein
MFRRSGYRFADQNMHHEGMEGFMETSALRLMALAVAGALLMPLSAAAQTITVGTVGQGSATHWPLYIAQKKGYFAAEGLKLDFVYTQSNAALVQQLAASSLDLALSSGLVDPIRAIDKGAPIAIVRLEMQAPPYALLAKPAIKSMGELKGKTISLGGAKDITRIFVERMLAPSGVKPGEFDMVFAGATSARFSALQSGAVDAAILLPPFNFFAESAGFTNVGLTIDYAKDLPFSGSIVNRNWAARNKPALDKLLAITTRSVAWFNDPNNRDEAIAIMVEHSRLKPEDVAKAYDFLHKHKFFESVGKISKSKLGTLIGALKELGDIEGATNIERFVLAGAELID